MTDDFGFGIQTIVASHVDGFMTTIIRRFGMNTGRPHFTRSRNIIQNSEIQKNKGCYNTGPKELMQFPVQKENLCLIEKLGILLKFRTCFFLLTCKSEGESRKCRLNCNSIFFCQFLNFGRRERGEGLVSAGFISKIGVQFKLVELVVFLISNGSGDLVIENVHIFLFFI